MRRHWHNRDQFIASVADRQEMCTVCISDVSANCFLRNTTFPGCTTDLGFLRTSYGTLPNSLNILIPSSWSTWWLPSAQDAGFSDGITPSSNALGCRWFNQHWTFVEKQIRTFQNGAHKTLFVARSIFRWQPIKSRHSANVHSSSQLIGNP